jgi:anaerobic selenocysteine-containing dehydrogenase
MEPKSPVGGHRIITGLIPCNVIPEEILTDHPNRFRAVLVESANPAHSLADSQRMREAFEALDFVVVIDVAMTETARLADYVLPASSQFEKWEATFFTLEFPHNDVQLRAPIFEPLPGTLPEVEIHARLIRAMGAWNDEDLAPLKAAAKESRAAYANAFFAALAEKPQWKPMAPVLLYETLGPTLPGTAAQAAAVWGLAHTCAMEYPQSLRRAGFEGEGFELGEALFEALLTRHSGVTFTVDEYDETWRRVLTPDGRIHLVIHELTDEWKGLADEASAEPDPDFPFILCAGERRSFTANTIYRDPSWRRKDAQGALRLSPEDASRLGIVDGGLAVVTTRRASVETTVEISDTLRPGHATLPNGLGLSYPNEHGEHFIRGVAPNELTASEDRDWFAGTPWHKYVPARIEAAS